jgi:hypothetical protein
MEINLTKINNKIENMRNPQIEEIIENTIEGEITPIEAVEMISKALNGINILKYSPPNKGLTINGISVPSKGYSRSQIESYAEIAVLGYLEAETNFRKAGLSTPGAVELSEEVSSKHHKVGFRKYAVNIIDKYSGVTV